MPNVVIASIPYVETDRPLAAPAVLKSALAQHGINSVALDLNGEVISRIAGNPNRDKLIDFFIYQRVHQEVVTEISTIVNHCATRILSHNPDIVSISLFTFCCQVFTAWLCSAIRQRSSCKIVIGGPGIKFRNSSNEDYYRDHMKELGLIDDYITGDGELSLVEYIKGNKSYPGINSNEWVPVPDLNDLPIPDYSDYNWFVYKEPTIPIVDSRGCVRECEFCDVIEFWTKYQFLTAENIFNQMLYQIEKYQIYDFDFRSSISNGNLREFKKLLQLMTEFNQGRYRSEQIRWTGSFIVRPKSQHPELIWKQLNATNATLSLGIESVVPHVRNNLGKSFNNEDIDYHLQMSQKYQIPVILLIIAGYPTETLDDYQFTEQWFRDRKDYANNSVIRVLLNEIEILPGTQLDRNREKHGLLIERNNGITTYWINQNLGITEQQRSKYFNNLKKIVSEECNFNL